MLSQQGAGVYRLGIGDGQNHEADSRLQMAMSSEPGHCAGGSAAATGSCQHVSFTE